MRQLMAFLHAIRIRKGTERYYRMKFETSLVPNCEMIISLDQYLGVGSGDNGIDEKSAKILEAHALKVLAEKQKAKR